MAACAKCGYPRYAVGCSSCGVLVCPDCKAPPGDAAVAGFMEVFCSEDCRDGTHTRVELCMVKCDRCNGSGKWGSRRCWKCEGKGKRHPDPPKPVAPEGKQAHECPTCQGRWQLNTSSCRECGGQGVVYL